MERSHGGEWRNGGTFDRGECFYEHLLWLRLNYSQPQVLEIPYAFCDFIYELVKAKYSS